MKKINIFWLSLLTMTVFLVTSFLSNPYISYAEEIVESEEDSEEEPDIVNSADGLSGTRTSTEQDFNVTGKIINYMKRHGSSSSLNLNYPYYLKIPSELTLSAYCFSGDPEKNTNPNYTDHVARGCNYFIELKCGNSSQSSLVTIPEGAFFKCKGLSAINNMSSSLTTIDKLAFYNDVNLQTADFLGTKLSYIGDQAFEGDVKLQEIKWSDAVSVGKLAFSGCEQLGSAGNISFVGERAFENCVALETALLDKTVNVSEGGFRNCYSLKGRIDVSSAAKESFLNCQNLQEIKVTGDVGENAFSGCTSLTKIETGGNTASNAFTGCTELTDIIFNGSVSDGMFEELTKLKNVKLSGSGSIGEAAFKGDNSLTSLDMTGCNSLLSIGNEAFLGCSLSGGVSVPCSVTSIGDKAFFNSNINSVNFNNTGNISIGSAAFAKNNITELAVSKADISDEAFIENSIVTLTLGDGISNIGANAFSDNTALKSLTISSVPGKVSEDGVFGNTLLANVTLSDSVNKIQDNMFRNAGFDINTLSFGSYNGLSSIGISAFQGAKGLQAVMLPDSITYIGDNAFDDINTGTEYPFYIIINEKSVVESVIKNYNAKHPGKTIIYKLLTESGEMIDPSPEDPGEGYYTVTIYYYEDSTGIKGTGDGLAEGIPDKSYVRRIDKYADTVETVNYTVTALGEYEIENIIIDGIKQEDITGFTFNDKKNHVVIINTKGAEAIDPPGGDEPEVTDDPSVPGPDYQDEYYEITVNYYREIAAVSVSGDKQISHSENETIDEKGTRVSSVWKFMVSGAAKDITVSLEPKDNAVIKNVYVDSVDKGTGKKLVFNDEYNHTVNINGYLNGTDYEVYDPLQKASEYHVDIVYYPEDVLVSGPEVTHNLFSLGEYAFVRYYFKTDQSGQAQTYNFSFSGKNGKKIEKIYADGKEAEGLSGYTLSDEKNHIIVIESEGKKEIPSDVHVPEDPTPQSPDDREYDDDGNPIDKTKPKHRIAYLLGGGVNSPYNFDYYYEGAVFYFREPSKSGYTFKGWYSGGSLVLSTKNKNTDLKLKASYENEGYVITYVLNGGNFKKPGKVAYSYNITKTTKLQKPVKTGYKFIGWFYGDTKINKIKKNDSIKGNITLVAHYSPIKYTIRFCSNGGSGKMNKITQCIYNQSVKLPENTLTKAGYQFAGWNTRKDGSGINIQNGASVKGLRSKKGTIKLYAQWTRNG